MIVVQCSWSKFRVPWCWPFITYFSKGITKFCHSFLSRQYPYRSYYCACTGSWWDAYHGYICTDAVESFVWLVRGDMCRTQVQIEILSHWIPSSICLTHHQASWKWLFISCSLNRCIVATHFTFHKVISQKSSGCVHGTSMKHRT